MRIALFLSILFFGMHLHAQPQKKMNLFLEAAGGIATGITKNVYNKFVDPRIGVKYIVSDKVELQGNLGYVYFFRKNNKTGVSFLPVAGGIDFNFVSRLFLEMQMGGALILDGSDELYFLAEPGVGWNFNSHNALRLSYYGFIANSVAVGGINIAYRFSF